MKLFFKIMVAALACSGFAQAATIKVKMIKVDPKARTKAWKYEIRTKKKDAESTVHTDQGTFTRDKTISIDPENYETVIRVYTNRTGAFGPGGEIQYKEFTLNKNDARYSSHVEQIRKNKEYGFEVTADGSIGLLPLVKINELLKTATAATPTIPTRKIKVIKGKDGNSDEWSLQSLDEAGNQINEVMLRSRSAGARTLAIPKDGAFSIIVTKVTNKTTKKGIVLNKLRFSQEEASALKELELNKTGKQQIGALEF